jgi:hypothetical protein
LALSQLSQLTSLHLESSWRPAEDPQVLHAAVLPALAELQELHAPQHALRGAATHLTSHLSLTSVRLAQLELEGGGAAADANSSIEQLALTGVTSDESLACLAGVTSLKKLECAMLLPARR